MQTGYKMCRSDVRKLQTKVKKEEWLCVCYPMAVSYNRMSRLSAKGFPVGPVIPCLLKVRARIGTSG